MIKKYSKQWWIAEKYPDEGMGTVEDFYILHGFISRTRIRLISYKVPDSNGNFKIEYQIKVKVRGKAEVNLW